MENMHTSVCLSLMLSCLCSLQEFNQTKNHSEKLLKQLTNVVTLYHCSSMSSTSPKGKQRDEVQALIKWQGPGIYK